MKAKKKKLRSLKSLRDEAWKLQSIEIRKGAANFQGLAPCYTCYRLFPWKELNAGHYRHDSHDFDLRNIKPQCVRCNLGESGRADEYYLHLVRDYGQEIADELRTRAKWNAYSRIQLEEIITKYKHG